LFFFGNKKKSTGNTELEHVFEPGVPGNEENIFRVKNNLRVSTDFLSDD
jgi:hypothetical protein